MDLELNPLHIILKARAGKDLEGHYQNEVTKFRKQPFINLPDVTLYLAL